MEEIKQMEGVNIGGRMVNNIRYVHDAVMIAQTEEKLQRLVNRLKKEC